MADGPERRKFLRDVTTWGVAAAAAWQGQRAAAQSTAESIATGADGASTDAALGRDDASEAAKQPVVVGIMGLNRGRALAETFRKLPHVEIRYLCDVDSERIAQATSDLQNSSATNSAAAPPHPATAAVQGVTDFRRILDDPDVEALICAAPNHWHGPATILACQAGKHVYVEKPCSHNPWEGERMIAAATRHQRVVQLGTQRRSSTGTQVAIERLRAGAIGRVYLARAWYSSARGSIGVGKPAAIPTRLDFELWQGPAPRRTYIDNLVHYNWHWRWHWGNGELGNNGIHALDLCRWGLDVTFPQRVTSSGGRYAFQDDQETPDTQVVGFEFPDGKAITWQGLSCNRHGDEFVTFYGTNGTLVLPESGNFRIYDGRDELVESHAGSNSGELLHAANFVAAVRQNDPRQLHAEITEGHRSTLLCHLGNIAQRTGRSLACDPTTGQIQGDAEAAALWRREYAPGWEPSV